MKTILYLAMLSFPLNAVRAHETSINSNCSSEAGCTTPVIYQAPVVYQAAVSYYAPVYYIASTAPAVAISSSPACEPRSRSTVIHITDGRGTYASSACSYSDSSVVHIGSSYARRSSGAGLTRGWFGSRTVFSTRFCR